MRSLAYGLVLVLTLSALGRAGEGPSAARPNIVFIIADDLGYGDVQCLNPKRGKIPTPNLDRFAKEGLTFTEAHTSAAICTPTRYGILTGRYNWRTRMQAGVLDDYDEPLIAADRLTWPALLQKNGYHTACVGKWHVGFTVDKEMKKGENGAPLGARTADGPLTRGFDHYFGFHHARMMESLFVDERVAERIKPVDMLPRLVQHASEYMAERAKTGEPFFLYLALNSPHTPIAVAKEWQGKSGISDYADYVMQTDDAVGRVLAALEITGVANNTVVVFTSDNGRAESDLEKQGHFSSGEFRGYKHDLWDGGHHVPMFVRWPGTVKAGSRCDQLVCLNDMLATSADMLGVKLPENAGEDSVSMLSLLRGGSEPTRKSLIHHSGKGYFAVRNGDWKLLLAAGAGSHKSEDKALAKGELPIQLYDMQSDPGEKLNVAGEHPKVVARLTQLIEKTVTEGRSTPGAPQKNDAPVDIFKKAKAK